MTANGETTISFSGQFGGQDAADAVLPHFWALKAAAKGIMFDNFPFPRLAFILRVDGEVNQYEYTEDGNPEIDKDGKYLSIDIEISQADRADVVSRICTAILDSPPLVAAAIHRRGNKDFDPDTLKAPLELLCTRYAESVA